ncbi:DsbA family oxidoreductase [Alteraurantiacibacter palmitatis]|uniref:DsbA family oxidoreductase n=1 Tax=Alteraurantiacibacter palmitatis TaxID=2054628 RepID=A0ABV7E4I4_9SPHN
MSDVLQVDIWSDVVCPWCAIGHAQFKQAVADLAGQVDVDVVSLPFELNPDMPPEGRDQAELLARAYGKSAEEVAEMQRNVEAAAEAAGFPIAWTGVGEAPPRHVWNTHGAHKLLRWVLETSGAQAQGALKQALFAAHFQQRRNISDRAVLLDLVEAQGLDRAGAEKALDDPGLSQAIRRDQELAAQNNIRSVPTFVVNGKYILQGSAEPESYKQALIKLASMEAMV